MSTSERLALWYAAADVFALPARTEAWAGPAVNEAMAAGLPVVASEAAASATDLVRPGENGFVVPVGDVGALRGALERLLADPDLRMRMGRASRRIIAPLTPQRSARAMSEALRAIHGGSSP